MWVEINSQDFFIQKKNFNNKNIYKPKKAYKKVNIINLKILLNFLKIFKNIQIKIYGFEVKLKLNKKNLINYLKIFKKNSSFLFKFLVDIVVEDFPKKKKKVFCKIFYKKFRV